MSLGIAPRPSGGPPARHTIESPLQVTASQPGLRGPRCWHVKYRALLAQLADNRLLNREA